MDFTSSSARGIEIVKILTQAADLERDGKLRDALVYYKQVIELKDNPKDAMSYGFIVSAFYHAGVIHQLLANRDSSKDAPNVEETKNTGGFQIPKLQKNGDEDSRTAVSYLNQSISRCDKGIRKFKKEKAWFCLLIKGKAFAKLGKLDKALSCFNDGVVISPKFFEFWNERAKMLFALGRTDEALYCYSEALSLIESFEVINRHPDIIEEWGDFIANSPSCFDSALNSSPQDAIILFRKGKFLGLLRNYQEAFVMLNRAADLSPDDGNFLTAKGLVLLRLGRIADALDAFDRALMFDRSNAVTLYFKGLGFVESLKVDSALTFFNDAIQLANNPSSDAPGRRAFLQCLYHEKNVILEKLGNPPVSTPDWLLDSWFYSTNERVVQNPTIEDSEFIFLGNSYSFDSQRDQESAAYNVLEEKPVPARPTSAESMERSDRQKQKSLNTRHGLQPVVWRFALSTVLFIGCGTGLYFGNLLFVGIGRILSIFIVIISIACFVSGFALIYEVLEWNFHSLHSWSQSSQGRLSNGFIYIAIGTIVAAVCVLLYQNSQIYFSVVSGAAALVCLAFGVALIFFSIRMR